MNLCVKIILAVVVLGGVFFAGYQTNTLVHTPKPIEGGIVIPVVTTPIPATPDIPNPEHAGSVDIVYVPKTEYVTVTKVEYVDRTVYTSYLSMFGGIRTQLTEGKDGKMVMEGKAHGLILTPHWLIDKSGKMQITVTGEKNPKGTFDPTAIKLENPVNDQSPSVNLSLSAGAGYNFSDHGIYVEVNPKYKNFGISGKISTTGTIQAGITLDNIF